jgi:hypothetical protein
MGTLWISAETTDATAREQEGRGRAGAFEGRSAACCPYDLATGFRLHFSKHFARKKIMISFAILRRDI